MRKYKAFTAGMVLAIAPVQANAGPEFSHPDYNWQPLKDYLGGSADNPVVAAGAGGALIIYHQGQIVLRHKFGTWNGTNREDVARSVASVSKSYAAMITLRVDDNPAIDFSMSDLLSKHFPTVTNLNQAYATMTMRQLASMTAGIVPMTNQNSCLGNTVNYSFASCVRDGIVRDDNGAPRALSGNLAPGSLYVYSGGGWNVLAYGTLNALNRTYGVNSWENWAASMFGACGWNSTQYQQTGNVWVGGGIETNLDEGGEMAEILLSGTCLDANGDPFQMLSPASLNAMRSNQFGTASLGSSPYSGTDAYGYGLFLNTTGPLADNTREQLYWGPGAFGSHVFFDAERGYSGFLYLNNSFPNGTKVFREIVPKIQDAVE